RDEAAQVLVDLGLYRVDDLQPLASLEVREIAVEPLAHRWIPGALEHLLAEATPGEHGRHIEDRVLRAAAVTRILSAQRLIGFEERQDRRTERVLHARSPEATELAL